MASQNPRRASTYSASVAVQSCPLCSGTVLRTARRPMDRVLSRFVAVQRYRCVSFTCQWEGNFRTNSVARDGNYAAPGAADSTSLGPLDNTPVPPLPRAFIVQMALVLMGVLFVMVFSLTDWLPGSPLALAGGVG